ncbi:MAG: HD domain-containing protein [Candidatus Methanosuratincola petrocarbonis]
MKRAVAMKEEDLITFAEMISDQSLRDKVVEMIRNPRLSFLEMPNSTPFSKSPASKRRHHSYESGLLVHTYSTTKIAIALSDIVEDVYRVKVNRDVVIAASLLHDLFKFATYNQTYPGKYGRSKLGEMIDHLSLITGELYARRFPIEVIHAVASHHGDASPIEPRTIEALILHIADNADAEMNDKVFWAAKDIIRECLGLDVQTLPKEVSPFKVVLAKKEGGCEEVRRRFSSLL